MWEHVRKTFVEKLVLSWIFREGCTLFRFFGTSKSEVLFVLFFEITSKKYLNRAFWGSFLKISRAIDRVPNEARILATCQNSGTLPKLARFWPEFWRQARFLWIFTEYSLFRPEKTQKYVNFLYWNVFKLKTLFGQKTFPHFLLLLGNKLWFHNFWEHYVLTFSLPLLFSPLSPWQCPNFSNQTSAWHLKRWECSSNLSKDWSLQLCPGMCLMLELHTLIPTFTILFGDWVALCKKVMNMIYLTFWVNLRRNQKKDRILFKMPLKVQEKCWI